MKPTSHLIVGLVVLVVISWPCGMRAQGWSRTYVSEGSPYSICSSADGVTVTEAGFGGYIYRSTNSGQDWNPTAAPVGFWQSIGCSIDGATLIAGNVSPYDSGHTISISHDAGASWVQANLPDYYWTSVASSANGERLVVVSSSNAIYRSADSGTTWSICAGPSQGWTSVASSADGTRLVVTSVGGTYISTNSGLNWVPTPTAFPGGAVAIAGDGTELIVLATDRVGVSRDLGTSWMINTNLPWWPMGGPKVVSSADGKRLAIIGSNGSVGSSALMSSDFGVSWQESMVEFAGATNPCAIACSADGTKLAAAIGTSGIFTYQTTPHPVLEITSSASSVSLSWIVPAQPFILQQSSDLTLWLAVQVVPALNYSNLHYEVRFAATGNRQFFRLVSQ